MGRPLPRADARLHGVVVQRRFVGAAREARNVLFGQADSLLGGGRRAERLLYDEPRMDGAAHQQPRRRTAALVHAVGRVGRCGQPPHHHRGAAARGRLPRGDSDPQCLGRRRRDHGHAERPARPHDGRRRRCRRVGGDARRQLDLLRRAGRCRIRRGHPQADRSRIYLPCRGRAGRGRIVLRAHR